MNISHIATLLCSNNVREKTVDALGKSAPNSHPLQDFILRLDPEALTTGAAALPLGQEYYGDDLLPHVGKKRLVSSAMCHTIEGFGLIFGKPSFDPELATLHFGLVPGVDQLEFLAQLLGIAGISAGLVNARCVPVLTCGHILPTGMLPCSKTEGAWGILIYSQTSNGRQSTGAGIVGYNDIITSIGIVSGALLPRRCLRQS